MIIQAQRRAQPRAIEISSSFINSSKDNTHTLTHANTNTHTLCIYSRTSHGFIRWSVISLTTQHNALTAYIFMYIPWTLLCRCMIFRMCVCVKIKTRSYSPPRASCAYGGCVQKTHTNTSNTQLHNIQTTLNDLIPAFILSPSLVLTFWLPKWIYKKQMIREGE